MRLDHVSYVSSHDQISDVVNRIGSQIGTAFVDGGIHPKFGTRNFTAPLLNGQYIEVVCPMDHPATEATPFGQAVKKKANEGGGWMGWAIATDKIQIIESRLERKSVDGLRKRPDGTSLHWKQIGVLEIIQNSNSPFFVEWLSIEHPSRDGIPIAEIVKLYLSGLTLNSELFKQVSNSIKQQGTEIQLVSQAANEFGQGLSQVDFKIKNRVISIK